MAVTAVEDLSDLSEDEEHALQVIRTAEGLHQSELWKSMDVSSRKGSRLARNLAEKGVIERVETAYQGNKTYFLQPVNGTEDHISEQSTNADAEKQVNESAEVNSEVARNIDESDALEAIIESDGLYQSELWKKLGVSSRKGSRLAKNLADDGRIQREATVYNGHNTYYLTHEKDSRDLDFSLLMAGDMISPFINADELDPQSDAFSAWIMNLAYEKEENTS